MSATAGTPDPGATVHPLPGSVNHKFSFIQIVST